MLQKIRPYFQLREVFAGCITALIFYTEYLSLATSISLNLPTLGDSRFGMYMVMGAVFLSCICSLFTARPLLIGPRIASTTIVIFGMQVAAAQATQPHAMISVLVCAVFVIVLTACATQLLGLNRNIRLFIARSPIALRKGFMCATATAIAVSAVTSMQPCLQADSLATLIVVSAGIGAAGCWAWYCKGIASVSKLSNLSALSMLVGVIAASGAYFMLFGVAGHNSSGKDQCGFLSHSNDSDFASANFFAQTLSLESATLALESLPLWVWPVLCLVGLLAGLVMLLESLTTLGEHQFGVAPGEWSTYIKLSVIVNLLCAPLSMGCSSFSASRTTALIDARGQSNVAVVWHGIALAALLAGLDSIVGKLPQLAICVTLFLIAIQMLDNEMSNTVLAGGFAKNADTQSIKTTLGFIGMVALSVVAGLLLESQGLAFSGGAMVALVIALAVVSVRAIRNSA